MPFTKPGSDISMRRDPASGRLTFDWDETGNPRYSDDNVHRVTSLLVEHRPSPATPSQDASPGWWFDALGTRGSLIYTVKNVKRTTPSQLEAYALDAMKKAVDEGWISAPTAKAYLARALLEVSWTNPNGRPASIAVPIRS